MQHQESKNVTSVTYQSKSISTKVLLAWLLCFAALSLAGWSGDIAQKLWGLKGVERFGLQALIMSGIILPGIWWLRSRFDRGTPKTIGIRNWRNALPKFALGISFIAFPLILAISLTAIFGWGTVNFNTTDATLKTLITGLGIAFLFEALPEELVFRGYIYSNLNVKLKRWVSALVAVALFVVLPLLLVPVQKYVFGMEVSLGAANSITMSYVITMALFGVFIQYLRILTGSIWTGVGFHLLFVYINRIIGPKPTDLIQFTGFTNQTPLQITFIASLALIFIALLFYPVFSKNKIGWKEHLA